MVIDATEKDKARQRVRWRKSGSCSFKQSRWAIPKLSLEGGREGATGTSGVRAFQAEETSGVKP